MTNHDNKGESFHERHERLTELAYTTPGMLPDRYVFILTTLCNLHCPFCFQTKTKRTQLKPEDWIKVASELPGYARVTLTGGEPLVFNGFREVFTYVARRFDCNVITNGTLLDQEFVDLFLSFEKFRVLSISVDSIGNTARRLGKDQWQRARRGIAYFLQRRAELGHQAVLDIKTLILDENASHLLAIHRYCTEELGCDHHAFQFLKGSPLQHSDQMCDFEAIFQKASPYIYNNFATITSELERIRQYIHGSGKKAFLHPKLVSLLSDSPVKNIEYINQVEMPPARFQPCKFPWSSVHINSDGNLYPCLAVSMGNVLTAKVADIVNGERFSRFREVIREHGTVAACVRCGWLRPMDQ